MNQHISPATLEEVQYAIKWLKTNKAADYMDPTSEHLKYGGQYVETYLLNLVNFIFASKKHPPPPPPVLKSGLITPIFKKGEKTNPANYRGITVTSILLKVVEHILNRRHNAQLEKTQSHLQKGFTAGSSSIDAALILSECISQVKPLILATLDAQSTFDAVDHCILLRKRYSDGITGDDWLLLKDMYVDMTSIVKWEANLSSPINIRQGVRQGGVLSTSH